MSTLDDFVAITITTVSQTPTQVGFGTPLVAAYHTLDSVQRVRSYKKLSDAVSDGIVPTGVTAGAYAALLKAFSQSPRPKTVKLGRLASAPSQVVVLTPTTTTAGEVYKFDFGGLGEALTTYTRTVPGSSSVSAEVAAIKTLLEAVWPTGSTATISAFSTPKVTLTGLTGMTAAMVGEYMKLSGCATSANNGSFLITDYISASSVKIQNAAGVSPDANNGAIAWSVGVAVTVPGNANVTITANQPGELFDVANWTNKTLSLFDGTLVAGTLGTDLDAIAAEDNDWYGLGLEYNSKAYVKDAATWAEPNKKLFFYNTSDTACGDNSSTTDVMASLKSSAYFRSSGLYSGVQLLCYSGIAWMAEGLPWPPGSSTFAFKTLRGVPVDTAVSTTQEGVILGKNGNTYTNVAGFNITNPGKSAAGEYIDIAFGRDWLEARMKERVFGSLVSVRKLPFTQVGVDKVVADVKAQLQDGIAATFLSPDPAPVVTAPKVADVSTADRANRTLPDVTFSATLAGAIQAVEISGTISV